MSDDLPVAIVGYGLSGRVFHAPLVSATPGMSVAAIVTSDPARRAQAREDHPRARLLSSPDELWARSSDTGLAVVCTPTGSHAALAERTIDAGLSVVVEKPLASSAAEARRVVNRAAAAHVLLTVFHNRRWDSDLLTLRRLLSQGVLGEVMRYESRFERWRPDPGQTSWRETLRAREGGGVLLDLGAHLVDQAMVLFGPVAAVYAELFARRGGADDDAFVALAHRSGVRSHLWAGALAAAPGPRLRVLGTRAAFVVEGLDSQEQSLREGNRPGDPSFGVEPEERWGWVRRGDGAEPVRSEPGRWREFYSALSHALRDGGPPPVDPSAAIAGLEVLDAARRSAAEGEVIALVS